MNKLEEQINERSEKAYVNCHPAEHTQRAFKQGAQFVIDLDLPVKFAGWIDSIHIHYTDPENKGVFCVKGIMNRYFKDFKELYQFWIENIYGK